MNNKSAERILSLVREDQKRKRDCLLCGTQTISRGVFLPKDPSIYGGVPEKQRVIIYPLCESCPNTPESLATIEDILEGQLGRKDTP